MTMGERVELWGLETGSVEAARRALEEALGVPFTRHESATVGTYWFAELCGGHAELTLRPNLDPDFDPDVDDEEGALAEPEFEEFGTLLYVEWKRQDHDCRRTFDELGDEIQLLAVEEDGEDREGDGR